MSITGNFSKTLVAAIDDNQPEPQLLSRFNALVSDVQRARLILNTAVQNVANRLWNSGLGDEPVEDMTYADLHVACF